VAVAVVDEYAKVAVPCAVPKLNPLRVILAVYVV
jgi:hypothetical protein